MNVGYCLGAEAAVLRTALAAIPDWQYVILQSPGDIQFTRYEAATAWQDWPQGVVFGPTAHLEWRYRRGGRWHVVILTTGALPAGFTPAGQATSSGETAFYLWGEREFTSDGQAPPTWLEGRIPQRISGRRGYPLATAPPAGPWRIQLQVEVLELPGQAPSDPEEFDPSPPRRLERYLCLQEVCGEGI